ncbi:hypothetical protein [Paraburkholderia lacunae]|uniref:hypothetical protein n=1 Tax=Paraburkholderia lacunae TaxID=2211104 RepID=UPI00105849E9|nr:hypothetical protein [Paraburkholderia lacunae]
MAPRTSSAPRLIEATARETRTVAFVFPPGSRRIPDLSEYFPAEMNVTTPDVASRGGHAANPSRMALRTGREGKKAGCSSRPMYEMCAYKSSRLHAACAAKVGLKRTASGPNPKLQSEGDRTQTSA